MTVLYAATGIENAMIGLEIMGFGMAGIFAVLFLIFTAVKLLIRIFPEK